MEVDVPKNTKTPTPQTKAETASRKTAGAKAKSPSAGNADSKTEAEAKISTYSGGCHCGKVRYDVTTTIGPVMACNCSMCQKRGSLLTFVPAEQFDLRKGEDALTDYQFNKHIIHHLFCSTCGISSFSRGKSPDGKAMIAINVRCLDGIDLDALEVMKFDGRSR
jgi:hypothetical protein